jgi:hypothetical protein
MKQRGTIDDPANLDSGESLSSSARMIEGKRENTCRRAVRPPQVRLPHDSFFHLDDPRTATKRYLRNTVTAESSRRACSSNNQAPGENKMAAFCACCGAEITLKLEACPACGTPRHGMMPPELRPKLDLDRDQLQAQIDVERPRRSRL